MEEDDDEGKDEDEEENGEEGHWLWEEGDQLNDICLRVDGWNILLLEDESTKWHRSRD
jgi:hypothetical protein